MPEDNHTPILLGRPFMETGGVVIDNQKGILKFNVGEEEVKFHLPDAIKAPMVGDSLLVEVKDNLEEAMTSFDKENGVRVEDYALEEVNIVSKVEGASPVKVKSNGHGKTRARKKEAKARSMRKSKRLSEAVKRILALASKLKQVLIPRDMKLSCVKVGNGIALSHGHPSGDPG